MTNRSLRIQLWSYNFAPEPTGVAPVSTALARGLQARGHVVEVVAAHPHYPDPRWGTRVLPYRELRDGICVLRLPLWIGRDSTAARLRQEITFTSALLAAVPFVGRADVIVAASPSFPALFPALAFSRLRGVPFVPWLHDILPDGAVVTGHVDEGALLRLSRWLERTSYRRAERIVVLSQPFVDNLIEKGVPDSKIELIYDPATREPVEALQPAQIPPSEPRIICMGNIGHTQNLPPMVAAFDASADARAAGAKLVVTGSGVAAEETSAQIRNGRVEMLGLVSDEELERELQAATLAMVSQSYSGTEFNLPSKLMNYMAYGLPVIAAVNPRSEVARLVGEAGCGWIVDSSRPEDLAPTIVAALADRGAIEERSRAGLEFAAAHFSQDAFAANFEAVLSGVVAQTSGGIEQSR